MSQTRNATSARFSVYWPFRTDRLPLFLSSDVGPDDAPTRDDCREEPSLASIVEELELDQPRVVTVILLTDVVGRLRDTPINSQDVRKIAYRLQEHGWLGRLRTRDAWEFIPGARAGTYGSGDRLIELRAQLAVDPKLAIALAMESAAVMLGYAQRPPSREVIASPPGRVPPRRSANGG